MNTERVAERREGWRDHETARGRKMEGRIEVRKGAGEREGKERGEGARGMGIDREIYATYGVPNIIIGAVPGETDLESQP